MDIIEKVEIHQYEFVAEGIGPGRTLRPGQTSVIPNFVVVIRTRDGAFGEYACMYGGKKAQLAQVQMLAPTLIGKNPDQREAIYNECKKQSRQFGFLGVGMLDICLWDLAGKKFGASVSQLLGGYRDRVPAYASTMFGNEDGKFSTTGEYVEFAEECHEHGFRAYKMHGWKGGEVRREAANVLNLARTVGDRMTLMLDPSCEIRNFADALYLGRACDEGGYFWYEDPFMDGGVSQFAHRKLRQMIKTPLLQTEHVRGVEPKADWIVSESTDFLRADPELDLGITGVMKIAHLAEAFGLDVELHAVGPAHRHCMSAIRNTNYYEVVMVGPGVRNPVPPILQSDYSDQIEDIGKDGCYPVPTGPGLGVELDWAFVEKNRTALTVYE